MAAVCLRIGGSSREGRGVARPRKERKGKRRKGEEGREGRHEEVEGMEYIERERGGGRNREGDR